MLNSFLTLEGFSDDFIRRNQIFSAQITSKGLKDSQFSHASESIRERVWGLRGEGPSQNLMFEIQTVLRKYIMSHILNP